MPATHYMNAAPSQTLTDDQIRKLAPSVFAEQPHASRSSRYAYIPTSAIVGRMRDEGFAPVKVLATRVRDAGRAGFEKHMIRFRQVGDGAITAGGVSPEVVLVNSHDGSSSYRLVAGLIRFVCSNGLIVAGEGSQEVNVLHTGTRIADQIVDASFKLLDVAKQGLAVADRWARIDLDRQEQMALAAGAHQLRFGAADGTIDTPIEPRQMLTVRRPEDRGNDLWTTFNRLQEATIKGGLHGESRDRNNRRRRMTTREVKGIDGNVNLNKALWRMAEVLAGRKGEPTRAVAAEPALATA